MSEMPMPGGWAMSMMWMRMPGQTWAGAAASFLGVWTVMMAAMMLPSLVPALLRYRAGLRRTLVGIGYILVWSALGMAVFPVGATLAAVVMRQPGLARVQPIAVALVVLSAGWVQLTAWKARRLADCREPAGHGRRSYADAWRHGVCLGVHCIQSCAGLTAIVLVLGVMNLRVMLLSAGAITLERVAPSRMRVERVVGVGIVAVGLFLATSALGK